MKKDTKPGKRKERKHRAYNKNKIGELFYLLESGTRMTVMSGWEIRMRVCYFNTVNRMGMGKKCSPTIVTQKKNH